MQSTEVELQLCYESPAARTIHTEAVEALAESIRECGLLQPITVRVVEKYRAGQMASAFEVIAGMHRVKACRWLGWSTIPANVIEADDLHAELMLIDENLVRNDLSPAERASAIARRKAIHSELHGSPKAKGAHAAHAAMGHGYDANAKLADAFTTETSAATGQSARTVQREAHRGEALGEAALAKVARTSLDKGEELDALLSAARSMPVDRDHGSKAPFGVGEDDAIFLGRDHYPTSVTSVIAARDVPLIAAPDCVLFLWATGEYKSQMIWRKPTPITGYWFRSAHELLLVGTRGQLVAPAMGTQSPSVIDATSPGGHSAKPDIFLEIIEAHFPTLPKIELNRRGAARPGWEAWGNEADDLGDGVGCRLCSDGTEAKAKAPAVSVRQTKPITAEVETSAEEELDKTSGRRKASSVTIVKTDLVSAVSAAYSEISILADECSGVVDGAPEGLNQTQRIQTLEQTADTLEAVEEPDVPSVLADIEVSYFILKPKRKATSRATRMADAIGILNSCMEALDAIGEKDVRHPASTDLRGALDEATSEADGCEFPGMYG